VFVTEKGREASGAMVRLSKQLMILPMMVAKRRERKRRRGRGIGKERGR